MPVLLYKLNGVPEDEAEEVRALLAGRGIDFYETSAGNWGVSVAAIWLKDESRLAEARALLDEYREERRSRVRREYEQLKAQGRHRTLLDEIRDNPLRLIFYLAVIGTVLYLSTIPFFNFREWL